MSSTDTLRPSFGMPPGRFLALGVAVGRWSFDDLDRDHEPKHPAGRGLPLVVPRIRNLGREWANAHATAFQQAVQAAMDIEERHCRPATISEVNAALLAQINTHTPDM